MYGKFDGIFFDLKSFPFNHHHLTESLSFFLTPHSFSTLIRSMGSGSKKKTASKSQPQDPNPAQRRGTSTAHFS